MRGRVRWAWIGAAVLAAVVLGVVGFWVDGWVGTGIGAAAGVVVPLLVGVAWLWLLTPTRVRIEIRIGDGAGPYLEARRVERLTPEIVQALSRILDPRARVHDDLVRSALAELVQPGRLLFNPPDRMRLGETERVEVRLTRALEMDAELLKELRGHGEPQLEEVLTAPLMAVTLTGDGFDITGHSDEEQAVSPDGITTWEFDIRAAKRGQQRLFMSVSLRFPVPGLPLVHKSVPVRETTIHVQVGAPALVGLFVTGYWQWLVGTAIAVAAVVVAVIFH
jgi:hypothetical protein